MKKIYGELARIQTELKAPKNLWNKFGQYHYRNAEGILEAVKPLLNGLVLIINDEPVMIGERFYIKSTVMLTDGEESVCSTAYAREDEVKKGMDGCQITGACSSYARKYALNALLMIDDNKDSDDDSLSPKNPENNQNAPQQTSTPASVSKVNSLPNNKAQEQTPAPAEEPKADPTPEPTPVQAFLLKSMRDLREARRITVSQNNKLFAQQFKALVEAKLAPNKKLEEYNLEEAEALIDAMYKNFSPEGTEIKK